MMRPQTPTQKPQLLEKPRETVRAFETNSCALNRRSENVIVEAIIVPELELRNVKMQVLLAHIVKCANCQVRVHRRPEEREARLEGRTARSVAVHPSRLALLAPQDDGFGISMLIRAKVITR